MIEVAVTEDERVDRGQIHFENVEVVQLRHRAGAEVQEVVALLAASVGLEVKAETELAVELLVEIRPQAPADTLHVNRADLGALDDDIMLVVDDHPDRQAVHGWGRAGLRPRQPSSRTAHGGADQNRPSHNSACA